MASRTPSYSLLRNQSTLEECERYDKLYGTQEDYLRDKRVYQQRIQEPVDNVVKVERVDSVAEKELCTTFYRLGVYVEHFPFTIDKLENLSFRHGLYVLMEVLTATRYLLTLYPEFIVDESKIFVSRDGRVKVWISDNPVDNQPKESEIYRREDVQTENDLVQIIFDIVESRTVPNEIPLDFIKPVRFSKIGLDEAISHIKVYCFDHKVRLAKTLEDCLARDCPSERCNTRLTNYSTSGLKEQHSPNATQTNTRGKPVVSVLSSAAEECR